MNGHEGSTQRRTSASADSGSLLAGLPEDLVARMSREQAAEVTPARPAEPTQEPRAERSARESDVRAPRRNAEADNPAGPRIDLQASISEDDLVEFNQVWGTVSGERSRVLWGARVWAAVPIVGGVAMLFFRDYLLGSALIALGLVLAIAAGPYYRAAVRRAVKRQLSGQNPAMMGPRRIVIDPTGVFEGGRHDRLQIGWPGIVDLVIGSDAFYIFYGTMQAVIVPKRAFRSAGDFERTLHVVERLYGRRATEAKGR